MPTTNKDKRDDRANSYNGENLKVYNFVRSLKGASHDANGLFDSAASGEFIAEELNQTGSQMPEKLHALFDQIDESQRSVVTKALLDGISNYETEHGCECPADIVNQAIHNAFGASPEGRKLDTQYDAVSASNSHADNFSLQPNRAVIAILTTFTESIPWAMYLPADIRSNEARLGILGHRAATPSGLYAKGDSLDGVNSGKPFIGTSRIHTATAAMTTGDNPTSVRFPARFPTNRPPAVFVIRPLLQLRFCAAVHWFMLQVVWWPMNPKPIRTAPAIARFPALSLSKEPNTQSPETSIPTPAPLNSIQLRLCPAPCLSWSKVSLTMKPIRASHLSSNPMSKFSVCLPIRGAYSLV